MNTRFYVLRFWFVVLVFRLRRSRENDQRITGNEEHKTQNSKRTHNGIREEINVVTVALLVRLEAKPGREADVEAFLRAGLTLVEAEPATTAWFGIRLDRSTFGIFDA